MASYDKFANITVHCTNEKLGCVWKGLFKDLEEHASSCDKELLRTAIIDIQRLEGRMEMKDREIVYLKNDFAVKIDHVSNERRVRYKKEFDKIENFAVVLKEEMEELREETKSENEILKDGADKMQCELEDMKKEKQELEKQLQENIEGADQMKSELDDVKRKNSELEKQVQENKKMKAEIDELRNEFKRLSGNKIAESESPVASAISHPVSPLSQPLTSPLTDEKGAKPFFDFVVGGKAIGRIVIDLFTVLAPATCEKFIKLCGDTDGVTYRGSRITYKDNACLIMGDQNHLTYTNSKGNVFPLELETGNENLSAKHNKKKLVSMDGSGGRTKSSLRIMFAPDSSLDGHRVIIGEVTEETWDVVEKIRKLPMSGNAPTQTVSIGNSGTVF